VSDPHHVFILRTSYKKGIRLKYFSFILFHKTDKEDDDDDDDDDDDNNNNNNNNSNSIQVLCALTQQPEGQLHKQHQLHTIYKVTLENIIIIIIINHY